MKVNTFRDLMVSQKGMELARRVYRETERMPKAEMFGLTSQMRRAAGSLLELMTAYELATSLGMLKERPETVALMAKEARMIQAMIKKLPTKEVASARQPKGT